MQVFVIGMHRSGTSALARILNLMGLYFGDERIGTGRSDENQKGFWERRDVRTLNDTVLFAAGCDWDCVSKFDLGLISEEARKSHATSAGDIVLNMDAHRPWFIKEPRMSLLLPVWREVVDVPVCIHVHRNPLEVADSLKARDNIPVRTGLALWEYYTSRALNGSAGIDRIFVSYEDLMQDAGKVVEKLHSALDGRENYRLRKPTRSELARFLDDDMYRQRRLVRSFNAVATTSQRALYELLLDAEDGKDTVAAASPSEACLATLGRYERSVDIDQRAARAHEVQRNLSAANLELQLAIKRADLRHAHESIRERSARLSKLDRSVDRLHQQQIELKTNLGLSQQRILSLEGEQAEERRSWSVERARLQEAKADLELKCSELLNTNGQLETDSAALGRDLRVARTAVKDAALEASQRREQIKSTTAAWSIELKRRKALLNELNSLANDLRTGIESLLASRRWRLGNAIVSIARRLALRRRSSTTTVEQLSRSLAEHRGSTRAFRRLAASENDALGDLTRGLPAETPAVEKLLKAGKFRHANLARSLIEHSLELQRRASQLDEARTYIAALIDTFEALVGSRRWRLGDLILSAPRRVLRNGARPTAADGVRMLIDRYREHRRSGADKLRAVPPVAPPKSGRSDPSSDPLPVANKPIVRTTEKARPRRETRPVPGAGVDVVVCVHNALDHVRRCLDSVVANTTVDYRLIVVNDGSGKETTLWLRRFAERWPVVQLIETGGPVGYTRAANQGLRTSSMGKVVLLNSDTIVPRLWLEGLLLCMASDESVGIVGPLSNAASWQSVPERSDRHGGWAVNHLPSGYNVDEFSEAVYRVSEFQFPRVAFLNGFCLLIDRRVIDRIGYLDEESFPRGYGEENDYCLRAREAGFELAVADHCYVYHAKSKSFGGAGRDKLAKDGHEALLRKFGRALVEVGSDAVRNSPELAAIRSRVMSFVRDERRTVGTSETGRDIVARDGPSSVLFVLPVRGGSGGANSVVQEAAGMRDLGVDARVATSSKSVNSMLHFYGELLDDGLVPYESPADLVEKAEPFDVIVATLWTTPQLLKPIAARWRDKLFVYYVQDYEPWFYAEGTEYRSAAFASYTLVSDMLLMAKTDWICRTVRDHHGVEVCRVSPSLDHGVFHTERAPEIGDETVTVIAMIRPKTPRRAPLRTLRVLRRIATSVPEARVVMFGCETHEILECIETHESDLTLDFEFVNHGVLTRNAVADLMRDGDVFIDLSDYQAFGRTGLEAMACGCAVVLPAQGGVYEYAIDGDNACVVDTAVPDAAEDAVIRLVEDRPLRERLKRRGLETASRYSVARASLSELSAFRLAWRRVEARSKPHPIAFRRGVEPMSADDGHVMVVAVLVALDGGDAVAGGQLEQRVLRPLRHRSLLDRVVVREVRSLAELCDSKCGVCVVHDAVITTDCPVDEIAASCRRWGAKLVYATSDVCSENATTLARAADRVVVPSASLGRSYAGADVRCAPPALDESLWLERSVAGERIVAERHRSDVTQVLFVGSEDELRIVLPAWREVLARSEHPLALTLVGELPSDPEVGYQIFPGTNLSHEDYVESLRARNQWDIAVLPVTESSVDADLRFLSMSALGAATIGSECGTHTPFTRHGENALLVGSSRQDWVDGLLRLIDDADLRDAIATQAAYDLETGHTLNRHAWRYFQAFTDGGERAQSQD